MAEGPSPDQDFLANVGLTTGDTRRLQCCSRRVSTSPGGHRHGPLRSAHAQAIRSPARERPSEVVGRRRVGGQRRWITAAHLKTGAVSVFAPCITVASSLDSAVLPNRRRSCAGSIELDRAAYGTHSLRRTKATLICRRTRNLRGVQLLLGHAKLESNQRQCSSFISIAGTVRYLGIEVDDALEIAERTGQRSPNSTVAARPGADFAVCAQ